MRRRLFSQLRNGSRWLEAGLSQSPVATSNGLSRLHPGLHKLDVETDWLDFDPTRYPDELRTKDEIFLGIHAPQVYESSWPEAETETWDLVSSYLCRRHPAHFESVGDSSVLAAVEGFRRSISPGSSPLLAAARLAQEDLFILESTNGLTRLVAAACCFSFARAGERARERQSLDQLHARVGGYDDDLAAPVSRFFSRVAAPVWRSNWSISLSPSLVPAADRDFLNAAKRAETYHASERDPEDVLDHFDHVGVGRACFCKIEFQTIRKLVTPRALLFTVRTYVEPFESLSPRAARHLAINVQHAAKHKVATYKNLTNPSINAKILAYLHRRQTAEEGHDAWA